ncbi:MAG: prepilin-type N-terminal cleavage/methylation domain-containing protein [Deltaproteobacteria bacterium]|jgi:prepilin-type N-terminal cleavage/methylation domain-containing protein|nr:prepilin-type N-terminal cleavage/methylation domain-containing protein [Deltaproteobacteria bacterium]
MSKSIKAGQGYTIIELLVVIGIIVILAGLTVPLIARHLGDSKVRVAAGNLDSVFQKARMMAVTSQKPVRVVLNCTRNVVDKCVLSLQVPVFEVITIKSWQSMPAFRREFDPSILAVKEPGSAAYDGQKSWPNIFWAIFMPDSRVYSDPRPFTLFFFKDGQTKKARQGWLVKLSNDSGRVGVQSHQAEVS